jgi:hypothetical protein
MHVESLSAALAAIQSNLGDEMLEGAVVFVSIDRTIDRLIQYALALGPHHPGSPSIWSHCFILLEPFTGPATRIADASIRDEHNVPIRDGEMDLLLGAKVSSGVCSGTIADYDNLPLTAAGVKWLPDLGPESRHSICAVAQSGRWSACRYDVGGVLRELIRLMTAGIVTIPAPENPVSSAGHVQAAYFEPTEVLFAQIAGDAVTPDDIWYSTVGLSAGPFSIHFEDQSPQPHELRSRSTGPALKKQAPALKTSIERTIDSLLAFDGGSRARTRALLPGSAGSTSREATVVLASARDAAARLRPEDTLGQDFVQTEDSNLALVLSAFEQTLDEHPPLNGVRLRGAIWGAVEKYENLDPGWALSLLNTLLRKRVPFIAHKSLDDFRIPVPAVPELRVGLFGDWGTGSMSSHQLSSVLKLRQPHVSIHLGDVYYSGTEHESRKNLVASEYLPAGSLGTFALNSNHEMYSGAHGYFNVTLQNKPFVDLQKASYFCLFNDHWQVIGLDSAYYAYNRGRMYQDGVFGSEQLEWLDHQLQAGAESGRRSIILSHHNPIGATGDIDATLLNELYGGIHHPFEFWYWGHEHVGAKYALFDHAGHQFRGRCAGHGGVPYTPEKIGPVGQHGVVVEWTETSAGIDPRETRRAANGFVLARLSGKTMTEEYWDEFGNLKHTASY